MMLRTQETLDGEIIVDSFAGGGGASTGIELALGRIVNAAINHDPAMAPEGLAKLDYMRICFAEMEAVDYVVFLPDWSSSDGAKLERAWCDYVGVPTANWDAFRVDMLLRKSHGCTFRELLVLEHPDAVGEEFVGGCYGCPQNYGYEPENKACPHEYVRQQGAKEVLCADCWDRIVPGSEAR